MSLIDNATVDSVKKMQQEAKIDARVKSSLSEEKIEKLKSETSGLAIVGSYAKSGWNKLKSNWLSGDDLERVQKRERDNQEQREVMKNNYGWSHALSDAATVALIAATAIPFGGVVGIGMGAARLGMKHIATKAATNVGGNIITKGLTKAGISKVGLNGVARATLPGSKSLVKDHLASSTIKSAKKLSEKLVSKSDKIMNKKTSLEKMGNNSHSVTKKINKLEEKVKGIDKKNEKVVELYQQLEVLGGQAGLGKLLGSKVQLFMKQPLSSVLPSLPTAAGVQRFKSAPLKTLAAASSVSGFFGTTAKYGIAYAMVSSEISTTLNHVKKDLGSFNIGKDAKEKCEGLDTFALGTIEKNKRFNENEEILNYGEKPGDKNNVFFKCKVEEEKRIKEDKELKPADEKLSSITGVAEKIIAMSSNNKDVAKVEKEEVKNSQIKLS